MAKKKTEEIITLDVITRLQDNGDGGYTMYVYNNEDELIENHPKCCEWDSKLKKDVPIEVSESLREEILSGYDEYENGYIGSDTIKIKMVDGQMVLAEPLRFHAGQ